MERNRFVAPVLLFFILIAKIASPRPHFVVDLLLYNAVALMAAISILIAPTFNDPIAKYSMSIGVFFWSVGSVLSSIVEYFPQNQVGESLINTFYLLFYPFAFIGIFRSFRAKRKLGAVEILDSAILGIGISALGSAFLMAPILPVFDGDKTRTFFAILFPIADLILAALTLSLSLLSPVVKRNLLQCAGVIAFTVSDFAFLWLTLHRQYSMGSLIDDGWLLGIVLISEGYWHRGTDKPQGESVHPLFIALSVLLSSTLLAITSLRPGYLPNFILLPTIATLLLAFIRMTIALRQSRAIGEERILARTDDLTGLPNRRRFIAELAQLRNTLDGALLLLDLDGFKPINDQFGHDIGDQLLKQVSTRFTRALPQGSLLARLGGDEFGAIVRGDYETTFEVALALRATLSYPFTISGREIHVDVSVGHVPNNGQADLLRRADTAMYQAKRGGAGVWSEHTNSSQFF